MLYLAMRGKIDICNENPTETDGSKKDGLGSVGNNGTCGDNEDVKPRHNNIALIKITVLSN